ncbi:MAG TPA: FecR family protein, partial [Terriglobales bacterium]|nr:FecR family protein [Terriglobales bacterium]
MKFKSIAAILGLGLTMAIPGAVVIAQNPDYQSSDQYSKPSAGIQAAVQGPSDQGSMEQDSIDQGSTDQGSMNQGSTNLDSTQPGYNDQGSIQSSSAPTDTNAGVARVSLIHGDVSTQRGNAGDWSAAALNAPVVAGDRVSTGDKARTELQLDYANMLRLSEHTEANVNTLTHSQIQIQLGRGMANYTVLKNSDADTEIDTPNVAIRTNRRESSFRILVAADDHTEVLVRKGEVEITTPQGGTRVGEGQFITVQGAGDQAQYKIGEAPSRDDWDQWNTDRDNVIRNAASRRRTNDYYVGAEDLDNHGTWTEVPDYGQVWRPNVADDWAPYRDGRWVDEPNWGWTWVSYDPWGWAPYHYGRWMMYDNAWAWWPGPIYADPFYRPIWAPAYVSFVGFGGGFGFGYGWGSIGWLPLG